jgi:hypothetical protein
MQTYATFGRLLDRWNFGVNPPGVADVLTKVAGPARLARAARNSGRHAGSGDSHRSIRCKLPR